MSLSVAPKFPARKPILKLFLREISSQYEIPERYGDSFYLANASLFDSVNWYLHRAYEVCFPKLQTQMKDRMPHLSQAEVDKKIRTVIKLMDQCNSIIDVRFQITRDNGEREIIRGFRAHHGLFSGFNTCLGGLRIKDTITRDHMKGLAALSTYKHSCMGIMLAGAHGGIKVDPALYSVGELQQIVENYARELYMKGYANGTSDIIEPDINSSRREMDWIANLFTTRDGNKPVGNTVVLGKSVDLGGIENHEKTASQGVYFAMDYFLNNEQVMHQVGYKKEYLGIKNKTFIIQGLGKLGIPLANYLVNSGAVCVGVKEHDCHIYSPEGLDLKKLLEYKKERGTLIGFQETKALVNDEVFTNSCDILILAAQQKSVSCYVADKIKAAIVVEAANSSLTPAAHRILCGRVKLVLPDIYVCSGYCVGSYVEYLMNLQLQKKDISMIRGIYKNVMENLVNASREARQVVAANTTQKIICCEMPADVLTYAIDHVMAGTGSELLEVAKEHRLALDLRTAGYIRALQCIHSSIFDNKSY